MTVRGTNRSRSTDAGAKLSGFAALLFSRAPHEDLSEYDEDALTTSAEIAFAALSRHSKGKSIIHVSEAGAVHRKGRPITVVTLINDNLPFLLDSVMGEIGALPNTVHLVLHPVLDIRRGAGALDVLGEAVRATPVSDAERVSVMQIHLAGLDEVQGN